MATLTDVRLFAKFRKFGSMLSLDEMIFFLRKLKISLVEIGFFRNKKLRSRNAFKKQKEHILRHTKQ